MVIKITLDIIKYKLTNIFPNYTFDFSNYSKISVICDKKS